MLPCTGFDRSFYILVDETAINIIIFFLKGKIKIKKDYLIIFNMSINP